LRASEAPEADCRNVVVPAKLERRREKFARLASVKAI
jgi:hypothetical protein